MSKVNQNSYGSASISATTKDKLIELFEGSSCIMYNEDQIFIEIDDLNDYEAEFYELMEQENINRDDLSNMHSVLLY